MLDLDENFEKVVQVNPNAKHVVHLKSAKKLIFELWVKAIQINIQEAANFSEDLVRGLRQRLGSFGNDHIDFDIKYKGVQFLTFDIQKIGGFIFKDPTESVLCFGVKQI